MDKTLTDEEIVDAAVWLAFPLDLPLDEWKRINKVIADPILSKVQRVLG